MVMASGVGVADELRFEKPVTDAGEGIDFILNGRDARTQLQITLVTADGKQRDVTREAAIAVDQPQILSVTETGYVTPASDGRATITATLGELTAASRIDVRGTGDLQPVSFPNQVMPVFTKHGCNGGGCHGKSTGQAGFKLSLLGFDPRADFERLVIEGRGRRVFPRLPERSLLLEKAVNSVAHGGGQRLDVDTDDYRLLVRWIATGMPYGNADDPVVQEIVITPEQRVLDREASQQLQVTAIYSDGHQEDVTRTAEFQVNKDDMAIVDPDGLVTMKDRTGDVAVMARYQGLVTVFRATVPLGVKVESWPEQRTIVDEYVFGKLKQLGIPPSELCDDSTFIRRATLDITGRLPTIEETTAFLANNTSTKYEELVDRLLASDDYAAYFAKKWSAILRNRRPSAGHTLSSYAFHDWLKDSFHQNKPYDELVRDIVAATGTAESNPPVAWLREVPNTEARVEDVAQLFLGQRLQCAKCHHHPYEQWSQEDYFKMAAFFSKVSTKEGPVAEEPFYFSRKGDATARHPVSGATLKPAGLDSETVELTATDDPRESLVDWMKADDNRFFAQSLVNRYWKHFFAQGVVEPEDDLRVTNPATNPELLNELSRRFVDSKFDLKELIRSICTSTTYRLASDANEYNVDETNSYSRFYPKRLQAEVLLDALNEVTSTTTDFAGLPVGTQAVALPDTGFASYFLDVFGEPESNTACECERSGDATLAQSLHLLNSTEIQEKLKSDSSRVAAMAAATDDRTNISELYLTMFSREPSSEELETATQYVAQRADARRAAYEDLTWALINSKEFLFNH